MRLLGMPRGQNVSRVYRERLFLLREVIVSFEPCKRTVVNTYEDHILSSIPTAEWQDRLAARLSRSTLEIPQDSNTRQSPFRADGGGPLPQRRRLDETSPGVGAGCPNWTNMYTLASSGDAIILMCHSFD